MAERIRVAGLARVEGEVALTVRLKGEDVETVELSIFEPPRFFEAFLRGRSQLEVPDITARICGICPAAYQLASCEAIENALGMKVPEPIRELRRLLLAGEWVESHALHIFLLHAPDFYGVPDAVALARELKDQVRAGLRLKQVGNHVMRVLGGREIHPVNVRVGGFYRAPARRELEDLLPGIEWAIGFAREAVRWVAGFSFPEIDRAYQFVSAKSEAGYPLLGSRIVGSEGFDIPIEDYEKHFQEEQVNYSTALHSTFEGRGEYLCGPLARFNLHFDALAPEARAMADEVKVVPPCRNPFKSIVVRALEVLHALVESKRIITSYVPPERPFVEAPRKRATGQGAVEAPRGLLYHRYALDEDGLIREAKIVPPTSQNQKVMETDIRALGRELARLSKDDATLLAERAIRNHDPCISCATHFLELKLERS